MKKGRFESIFFDRRGRALRIIFNGIRLIRLQDNKGNDIVMTQSEFVDIL